MAWERRSAMCLSRPGSVPSLRILQCPSSKRILRRAVAVSLIRRLTESTAYPKEAPDARLLLAGIASSQPRQQAAVRREGLCPPRSASWRLRVVTLSATSRRWRRAAFWSPTGACPHRGPCGAAWWPGRHSDTVTTLPARVTQGRRSTSLADPGSYL